MAARMGLSVPKDLSVAGFDDNPAAKVVWPQLTTVRQPIAEMAAAAAGLAGREFAPLPHFGGELFATNIQAWKRHRAGFDTILAQASAGQGPAAGVQTEEHVFSIAFALLDRPPADARAVIKRIWTSPRFNTAAPGDERLPLWHLPAEKRYGLADLYRALAGRGFPTAMPADAFRVLAGRLCAVPTRSAGKLLRDGVRQLAAKLGLRT